MASSGGLYAWEFEKDGRELRVRVDGQLTFNDVGLIAKPAIAGHGIAFLVEDHFKELLDQGKLVRLLEDWCDPFDGYYLYYPSRRQRSLAFRLVLDAPATAEAERSQSSVLRPVQNDCLSDGASFGGWLTRSPPDKAV